MWHNNNKNESEYNHWNFTKTYNWDSLDNPNNMWYNFNTSMLASTMKYKIGYESVAKINVALEPVKNIHQNYIPEAWILGIAYKYRDKVEKQILYLQSDDYNKDYYCPIAPKYNGTNIVFNLGMHFTESQYIHKFYTISDVFATVGGLLSSITLVTSQIAAFYIIYFLLQVSKAILNTSHETYHARLKSFLYNSTKWIQELQDLEKKDKVKLYGMS